MSIKVAAVSAKRRGVIIDIGIHITHQNKGDKQSEPATTTLTQPNTNATVKFKFLLVLVDFN